MPTRRFTISRGGRVERTVVGITGRTHVDEVSNDVRGSDGHFTDDEGGYRRAIERAIRENGG